MSFLNVIFDVFNKLFNKNSNNEDETFKKMLLDRVILKTPLIGATYKFVSTPRGFIRRSHSQLELSDSLKVSWVFQIISHPK